MTSTRFAMIGQPTALQEVFPGGVIVNVTAPPVTRGVSTPQSGFPTAATFPQQRQFGGFAQGFNQPLGSGFGTWTGNIEQQTPQSEIKVIDINRLTQESALSTSSSSLIPGFSELKGEAPPKPSFPSNISLSYTMPSLIPGSGFGASSTRAQKLISPRLVAVPIPNTTIRLQPNKPSSVVRQVMTPYETKACQGLTKTIIKRMKKPQLKEKLAAAGIPVQSLDKNSRELMNQLLALCQL